MRRTSFHFSFSKFFLLPIKIRVTLRHVNFKPFNSIHAHKKVKMPTQWYATLVCITYILGLSLSLLLFLAPLMFCNLLENYYYYNVLLYQGMTHLIIYFFNSSTFIIDILQNIPNSGAILMCYFIKINISQISMQCIFMQLFCTTISY